MKRSNGAQAQGDERRRGGEPVMVVDANRQFVGFISPGIARRAIRERRARIWRKSPCVLILPPGETQLPRFVAKEKTTMTTTTPTPNGLGSFGDNRADRVNNWMKFFSEEKEIWIQNLSATQLSMQFETAPGAIAGVLVPIGMDPLCLTNEVPWDAVKKSLDFRKFLNRVPKILRVMTTDEAMAFYADKARKLQLPDVQTAIEHTERERLAAKTRHVEDGTTYGPNGQVMFAPPKSAQELMAANGQPPGPGFEHMGVSPLAAQAAGQQLIPAGFAHQAGAAGALGAGQGVTASAAAAGVDPAAHGFSNLGDGQVMTDQMVDPAVLNLCHQVSLQLPANMRMPADKFWAELKRREASLSAESLQYIESFGTYKTIKKWARSLLEQRQAGGGEGIEDGLEADAGTVTV